MIPPVLVAPGDRYETLVKSIRMNQAGGVALRNSGLIYVADFGCECIWKIAIG